ncbi:MAG: hypothetical protein LAT51_12165 [Flavobacteriaceae bacterium]|nr:hypothetical protein [Flavobacteriaceae bacterium]
MNKNKIVEAEPMDLINVIAKSSVHLIVFDKETNQPLQYGSSCIAMYKDKLFVISVNHVTRIKGKETYTLIETGLPVKDGKVSYYSTGGLVYFDVFKANNIETGNIEQLTFSEEEPLDITFTTVKDDVLLLQKGFNYNGHEITEGQKIILKLDYTAKPKHDLYFGFFGHINHDIYADKVIKSEVTFKLDLIYKGLYNKFHLFNTQEEIKKYEDYAGTSGAPIIDEKGQFVALACSVIVGTKSVFAFPIDYCKQLMDLSIDSGLVE